MKLVLVSIDKDGLIRIATEGSITSADFGSGAVNPLEPLLGKAWKQTRVLLDLSNTSYIDSSAIGWMIGTSRSFKDGGGTFVIHSLQVPVRQILEVLKIGRAVPTAADETAARALASGSAGTPGGAGTSGGPK